MYLKRKVGNLEREAQINRIEIKKSAAVAMKARKRLVITKYETERLSGVVNKLQTILNSLEDLSSDQSDQPTPLESGSDNSWAPGPGPSKPCVRCGQPRSDHVPSIHVSTGRTHPLPARRSKNEVGEEWLSTDYRRRRDPLTTSVHPKRLKHALEPATPAYGLYPALPDEVPEEDKEWDIEGPDRDPMEDFGIIPPRRAASRSCWYREEEECMEGVHRGVPGEAYLEKPRRSCVDIGEQIDVAAVGTHGGRRWEPELTWRPASMVFKAAEAAVWDNLKDIRPPM